MKELENDYMSEITPTERMDRVEVLLSRTTNRISKLRTEDELDAVVREIFDELLDLENRIVTMENNLDIAKRTISIAEEE